MAYTDRDDLNYLGKLYLIGANQTPFLNMIGGLNSGKTSSSFNFPISQPWALRAADQSSAVMSEATSISTTTEITYTRAQEFNTCQIMKYPYGVSFAKQSTFGEISNVYKIAGENPVVDELAFQKMAALRQMAIDIEFAFLQGAYVAQNDAATVAKTQGIYAACASNNEVDGSSAALSKAMIKELLLEMAANGAQFVNPVMFVNGYQKQAISDLFGYAPEDRLVGGVNVQQIYTDFAPIGVVYAPYMPTDGLLIADMSVVAPVFCPVNGQLILDQEVATTTAKRGGFLYTQVGLDYGPKEYHGIISSLKDS
jgi:hypothetical protein